MALICLDQVFCDINLDFGLYFPFQFRRLDDGYGVVEALEIPRGFHELFCIQAITGQYKPLDNARRPDAELSGFLGIDAVADCDDGIEIIEQCKILLTILGSYPGFPDN